MAPSSTTHSFNTNQRVVKLVMTFVDTVSRVITLTVRAGRFSPAVITSLTCEHRPPLILPTPRQAPPSPNHAPPQKYMLFLLNGQIYSKATWVHLLPADDQ